MAKRSKIVNSLPRISTSTANTLTAITFRLKSPGEVLRYLAPTYSIYYSCVHSLFPSQKFSYRPYLRGAYRRSKACVGEMVGLSAGGYTLGAYRWENRVKQLVGK